MKKKQNLFKFLNSFRDQQLPKPAEYSPFSPESLDATQFSRHNDRLSPDSHRMAPDASTSVIMGPSEDLGLHFYQAITTRTEDSESTDPPAVVIEVANIADAPAEESSDDQRGLQVNLEQWNQFLEAAYVDRNPFEEQLDVSDDAPQQMRDSGIARPSFSGSVRFKLTNCFSFKS